MLSSGHGLKDGRMSFRSLVGQGRRFVLLLWGATLIYPEIKVGQTSNPVNFDERLQ